MPTTDTSNPLAVVAVEHRAPKLPNKPPVKPKQSSRQREREQTQRDVDGWWERQLHKRNGHLSLIESQRIERTWECIQEWCDLDQAYVVDLGCGDGALAKRCIAAGARVDGVEFAARPIEQLQQENLEGLRVVKAALPFTPLDDDRYDAVLCCDTFAHLPEKHYRLMLSEMARLVKPDGVIICSTPIDLKTRGGFDLFWQMLDSELEVTDVRCAFHRLFFKLYHLLSFAEKVVHTGHALSGDTYRLEQLSKRKGIKRLWFRLCTSTPIRPLFKVVPWLTSPLLKRISSSPSMVALLAWITRKLGKRKGVSHAIFVGKRRRFYN